MLAILTITTPIFIIMAMGYFAVRFEFFTREQLAGMGKFVIRVGLPMLVFHAIATRPLADVLNITYLAGYALASLLSFAAGWGISKWRGQDAALAALNGLGTGMSNTGFIGYPLLAMAVGAPAGVFFAMNVLVENMLILPLMFVLIDAARGGANIGALLWRIAKNLSKNPIIIALAVSLVFAVLGIPVPAVLEKVTAMMASASSPLALFVIGGGLYGLKVRGNLTDIVVITGGKLLLFPVLVVSCLWLFGADADTMFAGALLASVPMASMYPLFGLQYGYERQTAAAMLVTTLLSFFSISLVLMLGH
ncbi:AEC family transporter [Uruburuella testudinis]|uniref:AEC family transporter n=1 Tax=Uruburuella testudinis TaxID=1282863 RepID=A0ABY4DTJ9_9NEIS|nr:AEC family transporter [Uruburuella testudinis]UOO80937.1 AEC family transporter [Uruburuella testudinis]